MDDDDVAHLMYFVLYGWEVCCGVCFGKGINTWRKFGVCLVRDEIVFVEERKLLGTKKRRCDGRKRKWREKRDGREKRDSIGL